MGCLDRGIFYIRSCWDKVGCFRKCSCASVAGAQWSMVTDVFHGREVQTGVHSGYRDINQRMTIGILINRSMASLDRYRERGIG